MNWKVVVGILLILGGVKEFFEEQKDYHTGITTFNPIYAQLGCATLILLGGYLVVKGRAKNKKG